MNEIARMHPIGGYVPMVDGPEKVSARQVPPTSSHPGCWPGASIAAPTRTREILDVDVTEAREAARA